MPDTNQAVNQAIGVLRDELALQSRHCKLLEAQEQALLSCDRERFFALQTEHARMLLELEAQDRARRAVLSGPEGEPLTLSALKEAAPPHSRRGLDALEDGLRRTLDRVRELTRSNKTLIQNELAYLAFTLDLFVEAGRKSEQGYGPVRGGNRPTGRLLLDRRA